MSRDLTETYGEARLPRYTSYPTAPGFSPTIGPGTYSDWLAESSGSGVTTPPRVRVRWASRCSR